MKKLNNNGFSLVELIIVIAIMAILVGVVGTQVIPYLENSRQAKDYQILSSWNTAAMSSYSSSAAKINSNADYRIDITLSANSSFNAYVGLTGTATDDGSALIEKYFEDLTHVTGFDNSTFSSKKAKTELSTVRITISKDGDIILYAYKGNFTGDEVFDKIESK